MKAMLLAASLAVSAGQLDAEPVCGCVAPGEPGFEAGTVWRGGQKLTLTEIASVLAPILWFSSDEPLLIEGQGPLPHPHPCDPMQTGPVVYYQARSLQLAGDERVTRPEEEDPAFWDKVSRLTLRYYFYYPEDRGIFAHVHDLEVAELNVVLADGEDGCHRVELEKATGFAHGLSLYNNELGVEGDTRFPLTLLVEEGKHASCPDRNGDGIYTPGYDVNHRIHDAWGVRDVMGSGVLGINGFNASMAKPRDFDLRVVPPESPLGCRDVRNSSYARSSAFLARYELRRANTISACDGMSPESERLADMMESHKFGSEHQPTQEASWNLTDIAGPLGYKMGWLPPIALRHDRSFGISITPVALDLGQFGYLAAKINATTDFSVEGMMTPSASQFFSWYVSAGVTREYDLVEFGETGDKYFTNPEWKFVTELGVKFRARVPGKWRILSLGYHFAGIRFGVRSSGLDNLDNARLIIEIGAGVL